MKIHPNAGLSFNERAVRLLDSAERQDKFDPDEDPEFQVDRPEPVLTITEEEIRGRIFIEKVNPLTGEHGDIGITLAKKVAYFRGESAAELRSLVRSIASCGALRGRVGEPFVRHILFEWIADSFDGKADAQLVALIEDRVQESVRECEVWLPIANLYVESPVTLGRVTFRTITAKFLEERERQWRFSAQEDEIPAWNERLRKDRQELQGLAAGVVQIEAEPEFAIEQSLALVEEATALLRVCHPGSSVWSSTSHCVPLGSERAESFWAHVLSNGRVISEVRRSRWPFENPWRLSDEYVSEAGLYLAPLQALLRAQTPSAFQETVKNSLLLYSRTTIAKEIADKLVYCLTALESLLLRNANESIQQNVGERFAFILSAQSSERAALARLIKDAYGLRSRYLHHGYKPDETDILRDFCHESWLFFMRLPALHDLFEDRAQLLDEVERLKFR